MHLLSSVTQSVRRFNWIRVLFNSPPFCTTLKITSRWKMDALMDLCGGGSRAVTLQPFGPWTVATILLFNYVVHRLCHSTARSANGHHPVAKLSGDWLDALCCQAWRKMRRALYSRIIALRGVGCDGRHFLHCEFYCRLARTQDQIWLHHCCMGG